MRRKYKPKSFTGEQVGSEAKKCQCAANQYALIEPQKKKWPVCDNETSLPLSVNLSPSDSSFPPCPPLIFSFSPSFVFSLALLPSSVSLLCLDNEKKKKKEGINELLLCARRGVERKSICYLKTRGLRNNTEKHKRLRRLISGGKKEEAEEEKEDERIGRKALSGVTGRGRIRVGGGSPIAPPPCANRKLVVLVVAAPSDFSLCS